MMRQWTLGLILLVTVCAQLGCSSSRQQERLVDVTQIDPRIAVDIKYATADNFMHRVLYPVNRCALRESVALRLSRVQDDLTRRGYGLKIHDGYRPLRVQKLMWEVMPDDRFVANPAKGSKHNRGAAVDVTLIDAWGRELPMPSSYDEFSERAHRDYPLASAEARYNRELLTRAMEARGFTGLASEWWHFDAPGWQSYPVMDLSLEEIGKEW